MTAGPDERKDQQEPFELVHRGVHCCRWCRGSSGWFDRLCGVEGGEGVYIERSVGDVVQCGGTGRVRGRERKEEAGSV